MSVEELMARNERLQAANGVALALIAEQKNQSAVMEECIKEMREGIAIAIEQASMLRETHRIEFQTLRDAVQAEAGVLQNAERLNGIYVDTVRRLAGELALQAERTRDLEFISYHFAQAREYIFSRHYTPSAILMLANFVRERRNDRGRRTGHRTSDSDSQTL